MSAPQDTLTSERAAPINGAYLVHQLWHYKVLKVLFHKLLIHFCLVKEVGERVPLVHAWLIHSDRVHFRHGRGRESLE